VLLSLGTVMVFGIGKLAPANYLNSGTASVHGKVPKLCMKSPISQDRRLRLPPRQRTGPVRSIRFLKFDPLPAQSVPYALFGILRASAGFARRVGASHEITTEKEVPRGLCRPISSMPVGRLIICIGLIARGTASAIADDVNDLLLLYCRPYYLRNERGGGSVLYNRRELVSENGPAA